MHENDTDKEIEVPLQLSCCIKEKVAIVLKLLDILT